MSDIHQEYDSAVALVVSEYQDLQKLNPKHELLGLLENVDNQGFTMTKEFKKRYDTKDSWRGFHREIHAFSNCYVEFKRVVTEELWKILSQEKGEGTKAEKLEKKLEEKGLIGMVRTHITHNQISLERVLDLIHS
ncbi:MAG: hypothetical protein ABIH28_01555 [archaeon]